MQNIAKKGFWIFSLLGLILVAAPAKAQDVRSIGGDKYVLMNVFEFQKPTGSWDTMEDYKFRAPVKWVKHVTGPNPVIRFRWFPDPAGPSVSNFAKQVEDYLKSSGVMIESKENKTINGQSVVLIRGMKGKERYLVGVWRTSQKGFILVNRVENEYFKHHVEAFMKGINSVHIYSS